MAYSTKQKESFSDAILQEPERFVKYAFDKNPNIKDFSDFDDAFREAFDTPLGANAKLDSQDMIALFESSACKERIKNNVSSDEYDSLYGDGIKVVREPVTKKRVVTIVAPKVKVSSYRTKTGKKKNPTRPYEKTKNRMWGNAEINFIKARKQRKVPTAKIIKEYELHFQKNPRTAKSVRSKVYRV